jgi:hypothetical protein
MNYLSIGTITEGTLRNVDLLEAFADALEDCVTRNPELPLAMREALTKDIWDAREMAEADEEHDDSYELLESLTDSLQEFCSPYCYFGNTEGDGSDFGCWPDIEALEEEARQGNILKVSDLADVPDDYIGEVMLVNDHGNVTLGYIPQGEFRETWAIV